MGLPVLILTARDGIDDRVRGLNAGADDYPTKPFNMQELQARLQAMLRRAPASLHPGHQCPGRAQHHHWQPATRPPGRVAALDGQPWS